MSNEAVNEGELIKAATDDGIERLVVAALLVRKNKVLLLRRKPEEFMGGMFELPSGKVEQGETLTGALKREVKEETGLTIQTVQDYLGNFDYQSGSGKSTRQFNYSVTVSPGKPVLSLMEHDKYLWISPEKKDFVDISKDVSKVLAVFWGIE